MPTTTTSPAAPNSPIEDPAIRGTLAIGLFSLALVHVIDAFGKWSEVRYEFWLYIGLIVSCVALAGGLLFTRSRLLLPATVGLVTSALVAFILSRTTGLPNATDDIGNWTETIGVVNLFVEGVLLVVAVPALALSRRTSMVRVPTPATAGLAGHHAR